MLHVSALFEPSSGMHFKNYCFSVLSYRFRARDTSPFHSRRQEQPEDLPTEKTPTPVYEQQWAPNTIQTLIMICNAKGIHNAIAQNL